MGNCSNRLGNLSFLLNSSYQNNVEERMRNKVTNELKECFQILPINVQVTLPIAFDFGANYWIKAFTLRFYNCNWHLPSPWLVWFCFQLYLKYINIGETEEWMVLYKHIKRSFLGLAFKKKLWIDTMWTNILLISNGSR